MPAKSGKKANSIEYETKLSKTGAPAPAAFVGTETGLKSAARLGSGVPKGSPPAKLRVAAEETTSESAADSSNACKDAMTRVSVGDLRSQLGRTDEA